MSKQLPRDRLDLRAGDWVIVRSREEILATLDARGRLDELPFQPEMFAFCGRRLQVSKVAHKTCDTIHKTGGRRMWDTVHLEDVRCDGSAHGGCQADCLLFWKTAWLRSADDGASARSPAAGSGRGAEDVVQRNVRASADVRDPVWVCQATMLFVASEPLAWWDLRQYVEDVTTGNHSAWHMVKLLVASGYRNLVHLGVGYRFLVAVYNRFQRLRGGLPFPVSDGPIDMGQPTPQGTLGLKPGDWVEVKSADEIRSTLNHQGFNRGMRFDVEMLAFCGGRFRVQQRVERIINEQTGRMLPMKNPCIQLEGVYCRAECSEKRLGCPRAIKSYWREIWLRRVDEGQSRTGSGADRHL
ncbi:MAG TPA: hypothetical protein VFK92_01565 [Burkholderiales bacterium]|nr:hypothetical protein [Burkholderiales bacterium]